MSAETISYRVTFKSGVSMVFPYPGDLPEAIAKAAAVARDNGGPLGFVLLESPRMLVNANEIAVVHVSADKAGEVTP